MAEPFTVGACYTNEGIAGALGDTNQNYIRTTRGNRVVALCLNAWDHPHAPEAVWVGSGGARGLIGRSAQWLAEQCAAGSSQGVPLFIKDTGAAAGARTWRYCGRYYVVGDTQDGKVLAAVRPRRKAPTMRVIYLGRIAGAAERIHPLLFRQSPRSSTAPPPGTHQPRGPVAGTHRAAV